MATEYKVKGLKVLPEYDKIRIVDAYQIQNKDKMIEILGEILDKVEDFYTSRKMKSFVKQWIIRNRLYRLHLLRKKTKDCVIQETISKGKTFIFNILGFTMCRPKPILKIRNYFIKRKQVKNYKNYISEHRCNVLKAYFEMKDCKEIYRCGGDELLKRLKLRVMFHDLSKYSEEEFEPYRKNFFPVNEQEKQQNKLEFEKAWEHHWQNNSHHWQHRQTKTTFSTDNIEDVLDVLENVCDWMAMGYKFNDRPYQYYEKNKDTIVLNDDERKFLEYVIYQGIDAEYIANEKKGE